MTPCMIYIIGCNLDVKYSLDKYRKPPENQINKIIKETNALTCESYL